MVPEVGGNERLETHDTEEACRCLLEDKEKKIQSKKSFLSRFTHNFRFLKSWFWSLSSAYSMPVEENLIKTDGAGRCDQCLSNNQSCKSLPDFRDVEKNIYLRRNSSGKCENTTFPPHIFFLKILLFICLTLISYCHAL